MTDGTMRAIVLDAPGPAEALAIRELQIPTPRPGWVLIRVEAFGINRSELHTRLGLADDVTFPRVPGIEAAGVVAECPGGEFSVGQQVVAMMGGMGRTFDGGYAEYTCVPVSQAIAFHSELDWVGGDELHDLARYYLSGPQESAGMPEEAELHREPEAIGGAATSAHGGQVGVGEGVVAGQLAGALLGEGRQAGALAFGEQFTGGYRGSILARLRKAPGAIDGPTPRYTICGLPPRGLPPPVGPGGAAKRGSASVGVLPEPGHGRRSVVEDRDVSVNWV